MFSYQTIKLLGTNHAKIILRRTISVRLTNAEIDLLRNLKRFIGDLPLCEDVSDYDLVVSTLLDAMLIDADDIDCYALEELQIIRARFEVLQRIRSAGRVTAADFDAIADIAHRIETLYV